MNFDDATHVVLHRNVNACQSKIYLQTPWKPDSHHERIPFLLQGFIALFLFCSFALSFFLLIIISFVLCAIASALYIFTTTNKQKSSLCICFHVMWIAFYSVPFRSRQFWFSCQIIIHFRVLFLLIFFFFSSNVPFALKCTKDNFLFKSFANSPTTTTTVRIMHPSISFVALYNDKLSAHFRSLFPKSFLYSPFY